MARGRPKTTKTNPKGTHVTAFLDNELKKEWDSYCESLDLNGSQLLRRLIKDELKNKIWEGILECR